MAREIKVLEAQGHIIFEKRDASVNMMTVKPMPLRIQNMNDLWTFHLRAETLPIAINSGAIKRLPWERLVFGNDRKIPGYAEAMRVPEELLSSLRKPRDAALSILGGEECDLSLAQMIKLMKANYSTIRGYDRGWECEHIFLMSHVEQLLVQIVHSSIIERKLEKQDLRKPFQHILDAIDEAKRSPQCLALDVTYSKQLSSLANIVTNMQCNVAPDSRDVAKYSEFYVRVLKVLEAFIPPFTPAKVGGKAPVQVHGKEALIGKFHVLAGAIAKGKVPPMNELCVYRRYAYLLSADDREKLDLWVKAGVKHKRHQLMLEGGAGAAAAASSSSDGAGAIMLASSILGAGADDDANTMPPTKKTKASTAAEEKKQASEKALQKMFGGKARII